MRLKISLTARGITPSKATSVSPSLLDVPMEKVFPEPVCPYANTVALNPVNKKEINVLFEHLEKKSPFIVISKKTRLKTPFSLKTTRRT